jgi:hypothetical protein
MIKNIPTKTLLAEAKRRMQENESEQVEDLRYHVWLSEYGGSGKLPSVELNETEIDEALKDLHLAVKNLLSKKFPNATVSETENDDVLCYTVEDLSETLDGTPSSEIEEQAEGNLSSEFENLPEFASLLLTIKETQDEEIDLHFEDVYLKD